MGTAVAVMDLVIMQVILEVEEEATTIWANYRNQPSHFEPMKKETLEADALVPVMGKAKTLPNHKTEVALALPTAAEGFNCCQETTLSRKGELEK